MSIANRTVWIFDLDNTLYPVTANLFPQIERRMRDFIVSYLNLPPDDAYRLQKKYYREFGTTLRGLMEVHHLDPQIYLDYVHDIDCGCLGHDERLETALGTLPGRRLIYTNGTRQHARRILKQLGIDHLFEAVFDISDAGYVPKPEPAPYDMMMRRHGIDPFEAVMIEDTCVNLAAAARCGMVTVWLRCPQPTMDARHGGTVIAGEPAPSYVDYAITDLVEWLESITRPSPGEGAPHAFFPT